MANSLMRLFLNKNLPEHLKPIIQPFCDLAKLVDETLPEGPEKTTCLRKLREAKDCSVTAYLWDKLLEEPANA